MTIQDAAEMASLLLTSPTVFLSCWVLLVFRREAWKAFRTETKSRSPIQWFVLGVTIGFFGSVVDNLYWGIAWSASFIEHPSKGFWFGNGVYSNIPFRQCAGIIAAYCHIRCGFKCVEGHTDKTEIKRLAFVIAVSVVAGIGGLLILIYLR